MNAELEALVREIAGLKPNEPVTEAHRRFAVSESREAIKMHLESLAETDRQIAELQQRRAESLHMLEENQAEYEALTGRRYKPRSR